MARVRNHRGKWQVLYRDPATKRERSAGVFSRKPDAQRKRRLIEREIEFGEWIDPDLQNTTYQEWIARWMPTRTDLKPKTVAGYESLLRSRIMPTFAGARLGWLRTIDVEEWVSAMDSEGLSPSRIHQAYHLFSSSLKAAVRSGLIRTNPAVGVRLPKMEQREMMFLNSSEVMSLANEVDDRAKALVLVLGFCGLRAGEAIALRRSSINLMRSELRVTESATEVDGKLVFGSTKTRQARTVAIPALVRDELERHLDAFTGPAISALVFTSPRGEPIRLQNFRRRVWVPAVRRAGLPTGLRIHDMRHTAASLLINAGVQLKSVQEHLGHSSITTTIDRYAHLYPEARQAVAAVFDGLIAGVSGVGN
jgi:integrase